MIFVYFLRFSYIFNKSIESAEHEENAEILQTPIRMHSDALGCARILPPTREPQSEKLNKTQEF